MSEEEAKLRKNSKHEPLSNLASMYALKLHNLGYLEKVVESWTSIKQTTL